MKKLLFLFLVAFIANTVMAQKINPLKDVKHEIKSMKDLKKKCIKKTFMSFSAGYAAEVFENKEIQEVYPVLHGPSLGFLVRPAKWIGFGVYGSSVTGDGEIGSDEYGAPYFDSQTATKTSYGAEIRLMPSSWFSLYGKYSWSNLELKNTTDINGFYHECIETFDGNPISAGIRLETSSKRSIGLFVKAEYHLNEYNDIWLEDMNSCSVHAGIAINLFKVSKKK